MIQLSSKPENTVKNMRRLLATTSLGLLPTCNHVRAAKVVRLSIEHSSKCPNQSLHLRRDWMPIFEVPSPIASG